MLAVSVTQGDIEDTVKALPSVLTAASALTSKAAAVSPRAVPVLTKLLRVLPIGPTAAPLVQRINADAAAILRDAPSYAPVIRDVIAVLQQAPGLAPQIAAVTGPMAAFAKRLGEDPALSAFAARLVTIIDLVGGPSGRGNSTSTSNTPGVGLAALIPWLDRSIFVARHPWILAAVPVAVLASAGALGYAIGRRR